MAEEAASLSNLFNHVRKRQARSPSVQQTALLSAARVQRSAGVAADPDATPAPSVPTPSVPASIAEYPAPPPAPASAAPVLAQRDDIEPLIGEIMNAEKAIPGATARTELVRAVRSNPHDFNAWSAYVTVLMKDRRAAIAAISAMSADSTEVSSTARTEAVENMRSALVRLYIRATRIIPAHFHLRNNERYQQLHIDLGRLQLEDPESLAAARDTFRYAKNTKIGTDNPAFYNAWAEAEERAGEFEKALKLRQQAKECRPLLPSIATPVPSEDNGVPPAREKRVQIGRTWQTASDTAAHFVETPVPTTSRGQSASPALQHSSTKPSSVTSVRGRFAAIPASTSTSAAITTPRDSVVTSAKPLSHRPPLRVVNNYTMSPERDRRAPTVPNEKIQSSAEGKTHLALQKENMAVSNRQGPHVSAPLLSPRLGTPDSRNDEARSREANIEHRSTARSPQLQTSGSSPFPYPPADHTIFVNGKPYLILELIGKGGSSKVYKVLSGDMRIHALKRVKVPSSSQSALASYANEIELLQALRGRPTIIQLHSAEVNKSNGTILILLEYGDIDLAKLLLRHKGRTLGNNFRRLYWQQMLEAVQTIHEAKIVHGDLKPANFLHVSGTLKLIDFGIAKAIQADDTTKIFRDSQIGTPNYMSPEALMAEDDDGDEDSADLAWGAAEQSSRPPRSRRYKVGRASDIWSLGCILYQMVYGRTPFAHIKNTMHKLNCIQDPSYEIAFPTVVNMQDGRGGPGSGVLDANLLSVLQGCLQRDPSKRMSLSSLLSHPYISEDGTYAPSAHTPCEDSIRCQVRVVLDALGELGHGRFVSHTETDAFERELAERVRRRRSRNGSGNTTEFKYGVGGHSLSRMTPTSSAGFHSR